MPTNSAVAKKMVEYAKKHSLVVPRLIVSSPLWGNGKRTLAWRVSGHAFGAKNASAQKTPRLVKLLYPDTLPKLTIIPVSYAWRGKLDPCGVHPGIVWHHSAGFGSAKQIHNTHLAIGDKGIAYHFYVRRDGRVYKGRPLGTYGAHCLNHNDWIGVCAEGNYEARDDMPKEQKASLRALHEVLHAKHPLQDKRHKDMSGNATACPGKYFPFSSITE